MRGLGGGLVREGRWSAQPRKEPLPNVTNFPSKSLLKTYTYIFSFLTCTRDSSGLAKCMSRFRSSLGRCGRPQRGSPEMQKGNLRDISELIHINTPPPQFFEEPFGGNLAGLTWCPFLQASDSTMTLCSL